MKRFSQRGLSLLLALAAVICLANPVRAAGSDDALEAALADTAQYVCAAVPEPQVGSIGGEWAVLGLARSGYAVPEGYYQSYYDAVEAYVKARNGILHDKKYTEYARVILALTAIGRDARFGKGDFRSVVPRFTPGNIAANLSLVDFVREIAAAKGITPAQAALSWLMAQRPWIVSIPGSRSLQHLTDNIAAAGVEYTEEEMKDINERLSQIVLSGDRYPAELQARVGR